MAADTRIPARSLTARIVTSLVCAALLACGILSTAASTAREYEPKSAQISSYFSRKPGGGATGQFKPEGIFWARQTGSTTNRGTRPMDIIAILIGLKSETDYALAFSTNRCGKGGGGLLGKRIRLSATSAGQAKVKRSYRLTRKVLNRSRSMVLLSPETGKRFQACGRVRAAIGDYNGDGIVDASDF